MYSFGLKMIKKGLERCNEIAKIRMDRGFAGRFTSHISTYWNGMAYLLERQCLPAGTVIPTCWNGIKASAGTI